MSKVDKVSLDLYRNECAEAIEKSKQDYLSNPGAKLAKNCTGQKTYWKRVNNLLNKFKVPRIPPLLIGNKFGISYKEKAVLFNNLFVAQCQPFRNTSVLPQFYLLTGF